MTERERALLMGKKVNPLTANESALAYAVAHGGTPEPTYETVAEIPVGTMAKQEGLYGISIRLDKSIFDTSLKYYFNSADTPLEFVISEDEIAGLAYNFSAGGEILGTPAYVIELDDDDAAGIVSSEDLSNTTVRILKKVEQGGGAAGKLVVHLTETEEGGETVYSADKSVTEIIAADAAGQVVECVYDGRHCALLATENSSSASCGFSTVFLEGGDFEGLFIVGSNDKQDGSADKWDVSESEVSIPSNLKPTYEFGFSMSVDQQGNFTVTADQGSTFAAIKAALDVTPNVYAIVNSSGQRSRTIITADSDSGLTLNTMHVSQGTFILLSVAMDNSDTITTVSKTIT